MKRLLICVAALISACAPPAAKTDTPPADAPTADAAGNRIEALTENAGRWCTGDGVWCAAVSAGRTVITHGNSDVANLTAGEVEVWPHIIRVGRNDERAIVGLITVDQQMYSGGSASVRWMSLFEAAPGQDANWVLASIPLDAEAMIRACFTEEAAAARQEACHDEYNFAGALSLDPSVTEGPPRLVLTTEASSYPGQRTRASDSTMEPPMQPGVLTRWRDETCSYRRVASRGADGYVWDAPLPACSDYLEP